MTEYCPECIIELVQDHKKLGRLSLWIVCPKCGFRKRPQNESYEKAKYFELKANELRDKTRADILKEESD
jgi:ssDNA-binding Zn-finger/Zn-ribbon topoisomerase 1